MPQPPPPPKPPEEELPQQDGQEQAAGEASEERQLLGSQTTPETTRSAAYSNRTFSSMSVGGPVYESEEETADSSVLMDNTISGLFLSGRLGRVTGVAGFAMEPLAEVEEEVEEDSHIYFPDPPCVRPPDVDEVVENDFDCPNVSPMDYWKEHSSHYDAWPSVKEKREDNILLTRALGGGMVRTSSIMNHRLVVNVSSRQVGVRSSPSLDESEMTGQVIRSGGLAVATSAETKDGTHFWKLERCSGYVFDVIHGKRVVQEAMNVEAGMWWYRVACDECVEVRNAPDYAGDLRTGWILSHGSLVVCILRCRVGNSQWLLMRDGRGWLFVWKPFLCPSGQLRPSHDIAMEECSTDFLDIEAPEDDLRRAIPPTDQVVEVGIWHYVVQKRPVLIIGKQKFGSFLSPGDIVLVDKRCTASGNMHRSAEIQERVWLRLTDGRGWVPIHADDGVEQMVEQDPNDLSYPAWFGGNKDKKYAHPKHAWMVGFC